ncbi:hypothetical protein CI109_103880 [Kwoniella shandongensis]|uniref:Uncharacterized protein n=1 Tax=Kwoniella shandongensis TaxID=1734106 RepID=A0AAJ8MXA5_9TREE
MASDTASQSSSRITGSAYNDRHSQAQWLVIECTRVGVEWASVSQECEQRRLLGIQQSGCSTSIAVDTWIAILGGDEPPPDSSPTERTLHELVRSFADCDNGLMEEDAWTDHVRRLLSLVFSPSSTGVASNQDRDTARSVIDALGISPMRRVRPDMLIGLKRDCIRIALNATTPVLRSVSKVPFYIDSRSQRVIYELSDSPLGGAGQARIQNTIACVIGLSVYFHLATLAFNADPASFKQPTDTIRRVYGLQTHGGGGRWTLSVMTAGFEPIPNSASQTDDTPPVESPADNPFKITRFRIHDELPERHEIVGNWLYCLRHQHHTGQIRTAAQARGGRTNKRSRTGQPQSQPNDTVTSTASAPSQSTVTLSSGLVESSEKRVRNWVKSISSSSDTSEHEEIVLKCE